jgi:uncharacterized protein YkwD
MRLLSRSAIAPLAALMFLAILPLGCGTDAPTAPLAGGSPPPPASGPTDPELVSFVQQMNAHRVSLGLAPLVWDSRVAAVAQAHSQDMLDRGFFSHTTPEGVSPWSRLAAAGITYTTAGENIAWGYPTGSAVLGGWLGSPGHRANIENASSHHGAGAGTY